MHYTKEQVSTPDAFLTGRRMVDDWLELHADLAKLREAADAVVNARDLFDDEMRLQGKSRPQPIFDAIEALRKLATIKAPPADEGYVCSRCEYLSYNIGEDSIFDEDGRRVCEACWSEYHGAVKAPPADEIDGIKADEAHERAGDR